MSVEISEDKPVRSPCVGVCALDEHDLCIACRRHGIEIGEWGVLTNAQRREVLEKVARRHQGEIC